MNLAAELPHPGGLEQTTDGAMDYDISIVAVSVFVGLTALVLTTISCLCCKKDSPQGHYSRYGKSKDRIPLEDLLSKPPLADPESVFSELSYDGRMSSNANNWAMWEDGPSGVHDSSAAPGKSSDTYDYNRRTSSVKLNNAGGTAAAGIAANKKWSSEKQKTKMNRKLRVQELNQQHNIQNDLKPLPTIHDDLREAVNDPASPSGQASSTNPDYCQAVELPQKNTNHKGQYEKPLLEESGLKIHRSSIKTPPANYSFCHSTRCSFSHELGHTANGSKLPRTSLPRSDEVPSNPHRKNSRLRRTSSTEIFSSRVPLVGHGSNIGHSNVHAVAKFKDAHMVKSHSDHVICYGQTDTKNTHQDTEINECDVITNECDVITKQCDVISTECDVIAPSPSRTLSNSLTLPVSIELPSSLVADQSPSHVTVEQTLADVTRPSADERDGVIMRRSYSCKARHEPSAHPTSSKTISLNLQINVHFQDPKDEITTPHVTCLTSLEPQKPVFNPFSGYYQGLSALKHAIFKHNTEVMTENGSNLKERMLEQSFAAKAKLINTETDELRKRFSEPMFLQSVILESPEDSHIVRRMSVIDARSLKKERFVHRPRLTVHEIRQLDQPAQPGTVQGIEPVTVQGIEPGIKTGIEPGIKADIVPGIKGGVEPGIKAGVEPGIEPGIKTGIEPGTVPGIEPGIKAGIEPGIEPGIKADTEPGTVPGIEAGTEPDVNTGTSQENESSEPLSEQFDNTSGLETNSPATEVEHCQLNTTSAQQVEASGIKDSSRRKSPDQDSVHTSASPEFKSQDGVEKTVSLHRTNATLYSSDVPKPTRHSLNAKAVLENVLSRNSLKESSDNSADNVKNAELSSHDRGNNLVSDTESKISFSVKESGKENSAGTDLTIATNNNMAANLSSPLAQDGGCTELNKQRIPAEDCGKNVEESESKGSPVARTRMTHDSGQTGQVNRRRAMIFNTNHTATGVITDVRPESDKPAVVPDKPAVVPDKPAVVPDKPAVVPDKPAGVPDKPAVVPDKPAKPVAMPRTVLRNKVKSEESRSHQAHEATGDKSRIPILIVDSDDDKSDEENSDTEISGKEKKPLLSIPSDDVEKDNNGSDESDYDNPWDDLDDAVKRASIRYNRRPSRVAAGTKTLLLKSAEDLGRLLEEAEKKRRLRQETVHSEIRSPDEDVESLAIPFTRFSPYRHTVKGIVNQTQLAQSSENILKSSSPEFSLLGVEGINEEGRRSTEHRRPQSMAAKWIAKISSPETKRHKN